MPEGLPRPPTARRAASSPHDERHRRQNIVNSSTHRERYLEPLNDSKSGAQGAQ